MNLIFNGTTYSIPEGWDSITISQFQKMNLIEVSKMGEIDATLNIVSSVTGIELEELESLPYTEYKKLSQVLDFLKLDVKKEIVYTFTLNGVEYGLDNDVSKMTTRTYLDANEVAKSENMVDRLHILMAIMYRKVISKGEGKLNYKIEPYKTEDLDDRSQLFIESPISIAMAVMFFFSIYAIELFHNMEACSTKTTTERKTSKKRKVRPKMVKKK